MTEQKKPFPDNKHETRLVTESRPAGVASSTYREEPGKSIDMIEVLGEKPRVVRISQAMYDGLVRDGTQLYTHDFIWTIVNNPPVAPVLYTVNIVGRIAVPTGMAFDLTKATFIVEVPLAGGGPFGPFHAVGNWETQMYYGYRIRVDATLPWDSYIESVVPVGALDFKFPTNENYLDLGNDCPAHLVATEGQVITFEVLQTSVANPAVILPGGGVIVEARGRWIPIQHYKRIIHANALE